MIRFTNNTTSMTDVTVNTQILSLLAKGSTPHFGFRDVPNSQEKLSKIAQNHISTISVQRPHAQRGLKAHAQRGLKISHLGQKWARAQRGPNFPCSAHTPQAPRFQNSTRAQRDTLGTLSVSALEAQVPEIWSRSAWTNLPRSVWAKFLHFWA